MTGARAMTPGYSPPEQYGSARTDARSDIYSLGATLYAAITGVIPEDSLMRAVDGLSLTPLREHRPEISPRLAAVIEKALEVVPNHRYQTAEDFKQALLSQSEPVGAAEPKKESPVEEAASVAPPATPTTPRKTSCLGGLIVAFLALVMIAGGVIWFNPFYRDLFMTQLAPLVNATPPAPVFMPTAITNTLVPVTTIEEAPATETLSSTSIPAPETPLLPTSLPTALTPVPLATKTTTPAESPVPLGTPLGGGAGEIAFASVKDNVAQIFSMNADGTNLRQLTRDLNGACNFAWSPDGKQIVYVSPCSRKESQYPDSGLYVLDLETGATSLLFPNPAGDFEPAWSPDGTKIAFTSLRDNSMQIYVFNKDDSSLTPLTLPGNNIQSRHPAWSPDGLKLAYTVRRLGLLQIWSMDATGMNPQQLTRSGGSISDYLPAWAPDGQYLLFSETNSELTAPASLMRLALGDEKARIVPVTRPVVDADFSPDGQWIAYETSDSVNQDIFIYQLFSGSAPRRLTVAGSIYFDPAWRPAK